MIDLTPLEIRHKKNDFRRVMRGYDPHSVDDFLDVVAEQLEKVVRERLALAEQVERFEREIADYRERERALTEALVSAQEMREEMRTQTQREAELMRREAEAEAERIRAEARERSRSEREAYLHLRARRLELIRTYRRFLERELEELAVMEQALGSELRDDAVRVGLMTDEPDPGASRPSPPALDSLGGDARVGGAAAAAVVADTLADDWPVLEMDSVDGGSPGGQGTGGHVDSPGVAETVPQPAIGVAPIAEVPDADIANASVTPDAPVETTAVAASGAEQARPESAEDTQPVRSALDAALNASPDDVRLDFDLDAALSAALDMMADSPEPGPAGPDTSLSAEGPGGADSPGGRPRGRAKQPDWLSALLEEED